MIVLRCVLLCSVEICRGDQFIHLKVRIPKKINDRQKELLKEFEAEFEGSAESSSGSGKKQAEDSDATVNSAWQRIKDFMKK